MKRRIVLSFLLSMMVSSAWAAGEECTRDSDCSEGETCVFPMVEVACPPCAEGEDCAPCEEGGEESADDGECFDAEGDTDPGVPTALICDVDADCGLGLVCEEMSFGCADGASQPSGGGASSGGMPADPQRTPIPSEEDVDCSCGCEPDDSECEESCDCAGDEGENMEVEEVEVEEMEEDCEDTYANVCTLPSGNCESDVDCLEGFVCDEVVACASTVTAACTCAEGDEDCDCDTMDEPSESEEACEVVDTFCRPAVVACGEGESACPEGWICYGLPEEAQVSAGVEFSCLPEGWDVYLEAEAGGFSPSEAGDSADIFAGSGDDNARNSSSDSGSRVNAAGESTSESEEASPSSPSSSSSGLCSAGFSNTPGWPLAFLLFGFLVVLASRRERES